MRTRRSDERNALGQIEAARTVTGACVAENPADGYIVEADAEWTVRQAERSEIGRR